ncbi:hypothetical protein GBAR_LOCUS31460 [Geodia barretti]|uniref:Uncharacterized protein n=1 Tax=Geodia barretti TaxID=519541 RepID=A0AA35U2Z0_GEOBA|nr:hypothetical protein GBAR_LOCUS31460 [Geodia barretti]
MSAPVAATSKSEAFVYVCVGSIPNTNTLAGSALSELSPLHKGGPCAKRPTNKRKQAERSVTEEAFQLQESAHLQRAGQPRRRSPAQLVGKEKRKSPDYKIIPLPPLIKIANTVPAVGYSATTNTNQNNSEPSSSSVVPIHLVSNLSPMQTPIANSP